jgi:1,4-alpha-glucan branching enzyme
MERRHEAGLFQAIFPDASDFFEYRLSLTDREGRSYVLHDPYRFMPALDEEQVARFLRGEHYRVHRLLGARVIEHEGVRGTLFAVWAPHARAVSVMGEMNGWDRRAHPMRPRGATGMWEIFLPDVDVGARYKYGILAADGERLDKADPCGRAAELRPATASEVTDDGRYEWGDGQWMERRGSWNADSAPISIYEVHLGSWRRRAGPAGSPGWLTYRELADHLLPYVLEMGFTHVELLPILEHPLDESWGYQPLGFFAPTSRFGAPDDFRYFVDRAHEAGIGVLLDWVPGHFPEDAHGLRRFDGTDLYEHPDPRRSRHPDWGTRAFDFGRPEVRAFLISSALHWLEDYHLDGLRVDAVSSMLYLDYSRRPGEWAPNEHGGRENWDAVGFLRELNHAVHREVPGALMIAEESTAWPRVSHGADREGLGFDQKWNMGWMNDTLRVFSRDPVHRKYHYNELTFSQLYAYTERFVLPLSHDEVVHGKRSLVGRMPGYDEEKLRHLRTLYGYQWAHPGKKLLFMGGELAQWQEWSSAGELDWPLLDHASHAGIRHLVGDLNRIYREEEALHALDFRPEGFEWIDCHDPDRTILSFIRWGPGWDSCVVVGVNLTPMGRPDFVLPVPHQGRYRLLLNTDAPAYGPSSGMWVPPVFDSRPQRARGREHVIDVPLPGLSALFLKRERPS